MFETMHAVRDSMFGSVSRNKYIFLLLITTLATIPYNIHAISFLRYSLTIVVLILESHLADSISSSQRLKNKTFHTENNCGIHVPYTIISECHPCSGKEH